MINTVAVIVTNNRLKLLQECLQALLKQTSSLDKIIVVNNNSNDGTDAYLKKIEAASVVPFSLDENIGGAGGFNYGFKKAMMFDPQRIWVMDDDTIPEPDALEKLLIADQNLNGDFGFLAGNVLWKDNTPCKMNIPTFDTIDQNSNNTESLAKVLDGTFVSMFVNSAAVKRVGYPISDFFIWGDDFNFSRRVSKVYPCYFVRESIVIHKCKTNTFTDIVADEAARIPRYYYEYRNRLYNYTSIWGRKGRRKYFKTVFKALVRILLRSDNKGKRIHYLFKGFFAALQFHPKIETCE
ncbi:MAG: glycosyltransferase family 2 protein [Leuconostoc mesenteroides]|nr:glycosyltransferase family 2 protein [Leuconostoc mesenteroides]